MAKFFTLPWSAYVRRLRIDQTWYRVFHRKLRCLVIIYLKLGSLIHASVGQMHMYCNYAKEHWAYADENHPVGLILCADKGHALARTRLILESRGTTHP